MGIVLLDRTCSNRAPVRQSLSELESLYLGQYVLSPSFVYTFVKDSVLLIYHPGMPSTPKANHHRCPIEATMIQGTKINIGYANLNMTNHQINEDGLVRRYGA